MGGEERRAAVRLGEQRGIPPVEITFGESWCADIDHDLDRVAGPEVVDDAALYVDVDVASSIGGRWVGV
ncbi:hypothetical protein FHR81_003656 [Actinoalloteichus hoggarensis]|uniref:Uncharacterized protein n=1 Tax=Actinoalloteichus hoggarensis TaxID=1470176 RepID=A0A221WB37_9PSEU|nr:hypothetical protein [Actinoalloteichus hoggarensis]ASO22994.1 hypothetical protein AHOG_26980 [Actinoalloteichus hoggarensis]MBB5922599.1 hypothetical protein [Actinoalloteichus hoggarensis]